MFCAECAVNEMGTRASRAHLFTADYPRVFAAVCEAAVAERMTITAADPNLGIVVANTGVSFSTWGENLRVQVFQPEPGQTTVTISSGLKFGLVDWGKNAKNLDRFFARINSLVTSAPPAWLADPTGRHPWRWWDGQAWTDQVSDGGQPGVDPIG